MGFGPWRGCVAEIIQRSRFGSLFVLPLFPLPLKCRVQITSCHHQSAAPSTLTHLDSCMDAQQYMLEQHSQQQHQSSSLTPVVGSNSNSSSSTTTAGSSSVVPQPTDSQHATPKPAHTNTFVHKLYK